MDEEKMLIGIAERIRLMRKYLGYTQEEMAEKLDISYRQYRRYETKDSKLSLDTLMKATLLDEKFTADYLMTGYVTEDYMITAGIRKMPENEYNEVIREYKASDVPDNERVSMLFAKFGEYGEKHFLDTDVRDIPTLNVMTRIFEKNLIEKIESR